MSFASTSALHCRNRRQVSKYPFIADKCSGVLLYFVSFAFTLALHSTKRWQSVRYPPLADKCSAVSSLKKSKRKKNHNTQKEIWFIEQKKVMALEQLLCVLRVQSRVVDTIRIGNDVQKHQRGVGDSRSINDTRTADDKDSSSSLKTRNEKGLRGRCSG